MHLLRTAYRRSYWACFLRVCDLHTIFALLLLHRSPLWSLLICVSLMPKALSLFFCIVSPTLSSVSWENLFFNFNWLFRRSTYQSCHGQIRNRLCKKREYLSGRVNERLRRHAIMLSYSQLDWNILSYHCSCWSLLILSACRPHTFFLLVSSERNLVH